MTATARPSVPPPPPRPEDEASSPTPATATEAPAATSDLPVLYVAGPMSGVPEWNAPAFQVAADTLRAAGYEVIDPAERSRHLSDEEIDEVTYGEWLRGGLKELLKATGVALLPGWRDSRGASLERSVADALGMPVGTVEWWVSQVR